MSDIETAEVLPKLPNYFHPERGEAVPDELIGAEIVRFGTVSKEHHIEGGGLVIDFMPRGSETTRRIVFAFSETGMWVEHRADT